MVVFQYSISRPSEVWSRDWMAFRSAELFRCLRGIVVEQGGGPEGGFVELRVVGGLLGQAGHVDHSGPVGVAAPLVGAA